MRTLYYLLFLVVACGGTAVLDGDGAGQGGSGTTTRTATTNSTSSAGANTTTGPSGCDNHGDCPGGVCVFPTGTCSTACEAFCGVCEEGMICDPCGTSSCPDCLDCMAACVPIVSGQCDDLNPCPIGQACLFDVRQCTPSCSNGSQCPAPLMCAQCATSSCCGCDNCVNACL